MANEQRGYIFHSGNNWYVRYRDNIMGPDGSVVRKQVCRKIEGVDHPAYKTKSSVRPFVTDLLASINSGMVNAQSTMPITAFVDKIYLPEFVDKQLRPATRKQYKDVWKNHLKTRVGSLTLRGFRTMHGEQILQRIAVEGLGRSSLRHCKAFLSGVFKQAKRLGVLDGLNPMQDTSLPRAAESAETYAYSLPEITTMLSVLAEPERTVVLLAAFTGLRKSEIRGLRWSDFDGSQLTVNRSRWNTFESEPKTRRSKAPIPIVKQLGEALEKHRLRSGVLAQPDSPIFQNGTGTPLHLDNLARRLLAPAFATKKIDWRGWHAFRRGLATNLHTLGVDSKDIQAILRHSTLALTMNIYVKSVNESQTVALDSLSERMGQTDVIQ
jgi:integrase